MLFYLNLKSKIAHFLFYDIGMTLLVSQPADSQCVYKIEGRRDGPLKCGLRPFY